MRHFFDEDSRGWLKKNEFDEDEIRDLSNALGRLEAQHETGEQFYINLPKHTSDKVSVLVYLLDSITDVEGMPICFGEGGIISIPDEARENFEEGFELEELERAAEKLKKVKFGKRYSYPKKRGMRKG